MYPTPLYPLFPSNALFLYTKYFLQMKIYEPQYIKDTKVEFLWLKCLSDQNPLSSRAGPSWWSKQHGELQRGTRRHILKAQEM